MYSKVKVLGHPLHPMLVPFPIAFYVATFVSFAIYGFVSDPFWFRAGYAANVAAVVMALVAATPGLIDWASGIPKGSHAKRDGLKHMALNVTSLAIFSLNLLLNAGQWNAAAPVMRGAIVLPILGLLTTVAAGYLGWTLVQTHHVGVQLSPEEEKCVLKEKAKGSYHMPRKRAA